MKEEIVRYLRVKAMLHLRHEQLANAFWPLFNEAIENKDTITARNLFNQLPECVTRMKAAAVIEKLGEQK